MHVDQDNVTTFIRNMKICSGNVELIFIQHLEMFLLLLQPIDRISQQCVLVIQVFKLSHHHPYNLRAGFIKLPLHRTFCFLRYLSNLIFQEGNSSNRSLILLPQIRDGVVLVLLPPSWCRVVHRGRFIKKIFFLLCCFVEWTYFPLNIFRFVLHLTYSRILGLV